MRHLCAFALVLILAAGCASGQTLVVSGEGLKAVGTQFVATSEAVTKACIGKQLTVATCDSYRTFERKFKLAFPPAVTVQETAMTFGDKTMIQNATAVVAGLVKELGAFTALLTGGK